MMAQWWSLLSEPLSYPFMQNALIVAIVTSTLCAVLSCFLVLKGWSLMGDAISHAVLPGIVLAYWIGIPLAIGAFASGLFCAFSTGYIKEHSHIKEDTVMGIIFSGLFAIGLVLFAKVDTNQHLLHILFGNILGVTPLELIQIVMIACVTLIILLVKRQDFLLYCFDPQHCKVIGLPFKLLHYGLLCLLALTIVAALQAVGVILVIAMLIAPGIIALLICRNFTSMLLIAVVVAICSSIAGIFISYYIDAATAPCIVLVQAVVFIVTQISISYRTKWHDAH